MAAVTHRVSTASSSNVTSYASGSFTPAADELLVAFVTASGTIAGAAMSDSQGLTFSLIKKARKASNADTIYLFVANRLAANSAMTVTFDCTADAATGAIIQVAGVSGMTRTGADAVRQTAISENVASGTPAPAFSASALTGNPTLGVVGNGANPAGMTTPTSWTEKDDTGYTTPATGAEYVSRDSGFTGTTVTWGSSSGTAFGAIIVELDSSAAPATPLYRSHATTTGLGTSITTTMPTGWAIDDLLLLSVGFSTGTPTISTPSGWTLVPGGSEGNPIDGSTDVRQYLFYRVAQSGDTAPAITSTSSDDWQTLMAAYSGADTTNPVNTSAGDDFADTTATSFTTVSITPTVNDTRVVLVMQTDKTNTPATPLYTFTGANEWAKVEGNSAMVVGLADKIGPAASSSTNQAIEITSTDTPVAFILALAPASTGRTGTLAVTEADDTLASTGVTPIVGTASITEAADTSTATGVVPIVATASITEAADTVVATGTVGASAISGVLAVTEASDTVTATGVLPVVGVASITEAGDTLASAGVLPIVGVASITEAADIAASAGTVRVVGTASITEAGDSSTATGTVWVRGSASITEADDTLVSTGVIGSVPITGTASITESDDTVTSAGTVLVAGVASITEASDTLASVGTVLVRGVLTYTDADDTLGATGAVLIRGILAVTDANDTLVATGTLPGTSIPGTATMTVRAYGTATLTILPAGTGLATVERYGQASASVALVEV